MLRRSTASLVFLMAAAAQAQTPPASMPAMPVMPAAPVAQPSMVPAVPAAAQQLPEVNVPTVAPAPTAAPAAPTPTAELPAVEAAPATTTTAPAEQPAAAAEQAPPLAMSADPNDFSFGTSNLSVLFTPRQMERMKNVLSVYETARRNRTDMPIKVVEEQEDFAPVAELVDEPKDYPVFKLKSIAFRNARDWTVWIGDLRITPNKNEQEVRVLAVGPNRAQFLWKPPYSEALRQRASLKLFAPTDKVKHKMTRTNAAIFDSATGQATFTLLQNQTFSPAYMATFEGAITSPVMPAMPTAEEQDKNEAALPADTSAANPQNLDALLKQQQNSGAPGLFQRSMKRTPTN